MRLYEFLNEKEYSSFFEIGDNVWFLPMERHIDKLKIIKNYNRGHIINIKFSKSKVFYDIVDDYYGYFFDNIDSINVKED